MSPELELWDAITAVLKESPDVAALVGDRIFDRVPLKAQHPYLTLGPSWEVLDDADCLEAAEIGFRISAWSRAVGKAEALAMAHAAKRAILNAEIALPVNALAMLEFRRSDTLRDADGLTTQAVLEFSATVEIA